MGESLLCLILLEVFPVVVSVELLSVFAGKFVDHMFKAVFKCLPKVSVLKKAVYKLFDNLFVTCTWRHLQYLAQNNSDCPILLLGTKNNVKITALHLLK